MGRDRAYVRYLTYGRQIVDGWLKPLGVLFIDALEAEQRRRGVHGHVAEIGVHHGKLFIMLSLLRRPGENAVAIDLFEEQHRNVDLSGHGDRAAFLGNLNRWHPQTPGLVVETADSSTIDGARLRELAGGPLRLVSVDGGHTADLTYHDLATASDALVAGGIVVLDDCFNELFPSVSEGAQRFLRDRTDIAAIGAAGNKTFFTQQEHAAAYRAAMAARADALGLYHQEHESFVGRPFHAVFPRDDERIAVRLVRADYRAQWTRGWIRYHWRRITGADQPSGG